MSDKDILLRRRGNAGHNILGIGNKIKPRGAAGMIEGEPEKYGAFGDKGEIQIMDGPVSLSHMNLLRNTPPGKSARCKSWTKYAWKLKIGEQYYLGVTFQSGYRCYYPGTASNGEQINGTWMGILNAASGSYYVHDWIKGMDYIAF